MLRHRSITFVCRSCGCQFHAPDIEYLCTALSAPQPCPECKRYRTRPTAWTLPQIADLPYLPVWQKIESECQSDKKSKELGLRSMTQE